MGTYCICGGRIKSYLSEGIWCTRMRKDTNKMLWERRKRQRRRRRRRCGLRYTFSGVPKYVVQCNHLWVYNGVAGGVPHLIL